LNKLMKIVILAVESRSTWMVVNAICLMHSNVRVLFINKQKIGNLMAKRYKRYGFFHTANQALFVIFSKFFLSKNRRYTDKLIKDANLIDRNLFNVPVQKIENDSDKALANIIRKEDPDLIVVNGTKILSNTLLKSCNVKFINLHCGITPAYRGVHGAYWALFNCDNENCGVTIHEIDSGIDTGGVYYQRRIDISSEDNFNTYPIKQYIAGVPLMLRAINDIKNGKDCYIQTQLNSNLFQHPTLTQYLKGRIFKGVK